MGRNSVTKVIMAWSGGKDSAEALWRLQKDPSYEVAGLLTTVTETYQRISMHGVRVALLEAQAAALGLPLFQVLIPTQCSNADYEAKMGAAIAPLLEQGVTAMGFGDLFLEDIRAYRERMLAPTGLQPLFPIWGEPTAALARAIVAAGFRATLCCVDPRALAPEYAGRSYDTSLLEELPASVDPCGENGEFHTFVFDGPNFSRPVAVLPGERVEREGFWFFDLVPGPTPGEGPRARKPSRTSRKGRIPPALRKNLLFRSFGFRRERSAGEQKFRGRAAGDRTYRHSL